MTPMRFFGRSCSTLLLAASYWLLRLPHGTITIVAAIALSAR